MIDQNTQQIAKHVADVTSYGAIAATFLGYLPTIAAVFSILWISIQIWESKTAIKLRARLRRKK
jgi:hypothetical protein